MKHLLVKQGYTFRGTICFDKAYKTIKQQEKLGKSREEINALLMENFGEKNPDVKVQ